jgi:hypothetical protein
MTTGTLRLALLCSVLLVSSCTTKRYYQGRDDHVGYRMSKHFLGYRPKLDGTYLEYQYRKKKELNMTFKRHFLNDGDEVIRNRDDAQLTAQRPPHSVFPDFPYYMHAESVATGLVTLGMTGSFIPVPVDSVGATVLGGPPAWGEFVDGFTGGGGAVAEEPPSNSRFRVKNR